jgi:thiol-disulfide isomerase/thioredoxin
MTIDGHDRVASNVMVFRCAAPAGRGAFHRSSLSLTAALALVVLACATLARAGDSLELQPWTGDPQLNFSLDDLSREPVSLGDARGDIVLVHFFATWCEPCRDELPTLHRLVTARKALFGSWEGNWLAYNFAHDLVLPGAKGPELEFLMYPQAETAVGRLDCLDPDTFKYTITAKELNV